MRAGRIVVAAGLLCFACESEEPAPIAPTVDASRDAGQHDASSDADVDATAHDGASDGSTPVGECIPEFTELAELAELSAGEISVSAGPNALVAWNRGGRLYFKRGTQATSSIELEGNIGPPSVAGDLVVWSQEDLDGDTLVIRAVRVDDQGAASDIVALSDTPDVDTLRPSIAQWSDGYFLVWLGLGDEATRVLGRWVSSDLALSPIMTIAEAAEPEAPQVASSGSRALIGWRWGSDVLIRALDASQELGAIHTVNEAFPALGRARIALDDDAALVVYEGDVSGARHLYGRRLRPEGEPYGAELDLGALGELDARSASVGTYLGGYAVAYRGLSRGAIDHLARLAFIHGSTGDRVDTVDLSAVPVSGGPIALAVADDGAIEMGWVSVWPVGSQAVAARLRCPDTWLRCSPER